MVTQHDTPVATMRRSVPVRYASSDAPIPRCAVCGGAVCELVDPSADGGPRFVAVEPGPGVVGEPFARPWMQRHADVCPGRFVRP